MIFGLVLAVHIFEALCLRMDETVLAENFINKLFGIAVIFIVICILQWKLSDIGFSKTGVLKSIGIGLALSVSTFFIAYLGEIIILKCQGYSVSLKIFTTSFSLVGEPVINRGIGYILLCILFNIINVIMEEWLFRGLFTKLVSTNHSIKTAILFQSLLFGVWHIVTPLRNLIDGDLSVVAFIGLSVGYVILAGLMGIKWALLYRMTGNLYAGMVDHFVNNCIASNLLHICTRSGIDEFMIVRIAIAQIISFVVVCIAFHKWKTKQKKYEQERGVN